MGPWENARQCEWGHPHILAVEHDSRLRGFRVDLQGARDWAEEPLTFRRIGVDRGPSGPYAEECTNEAGDGCEDGTGKKRTAQARARQRGGIDGWVQNWGGVRLLRRNVQRRSPSALARSL